MNVDEKGQHIVDIRQCLVDSVFCGIFRLLLFYFVMANQMFVFLNNISIQLCFLFQGWLSKRYKRTARRSYLRIINHFFSINNKVSSHDHGIDPNKSNIHIINLFSHTKSHVFATKSWCTKINSSILSLMVPLKKKMPPWLPKVPRRPTPPPMCTDSGLLRYFRPRSSISPKSSIFRV